MFGFVDDQVTGTRRHWEKQVNRNDEFVWNDYSSVSSWSERKPITRFYSHKFSFHETFFVQKFTHQMDFFEHGYTQIAINQEIFKASCAHKVNV